jgi:hypothetical protein
MRAAAVDATTHRLASALTDAFSVSVLVATPASSYSRISGSEADQINNSNEQINSHKH